MADKPQEVGLAQQVVEKEKETNVLDKLKQLVPAPKPLDNETKPKTATCGIRG